MSRTQQVFVIIVAAVNLCGFIAWSMLMERIHAAPRQPLVATQQTVPLRYKGTTRFIRPLDEKLLRWSDSPWPLIIVFSEFAVLVWLGVRSGAQLNRQAALNGGRLAITVGIALALIIGGLTTLVGLHRDRALYPVVTLVVASYYALFALMGGSMTVLLIESSVAVAFVSLAIAGFKSTLWLVVAALAAHGIFDLAHPHIYANPGVPVWWPPFCSAYDVVAAAFLAWLIASKRVRAHAA